MGGNIPRADCSSLESATYLKPRKGINNKFSYSTLKYGYDRSKLEEQQWVNNLRSKSMMSYELTETLEAYIDQGALDEIAESRVRREQEELERLRMVKVYRKRRIMAAIFVLLFVYGMYWICSNIYHRLSRSERDEL